MPATARVHIGPPLKRFGQAWWPASAALALLAVWLSVNVASADPRAAMPAAQGTSSRGSAPKTSTPASPATLPAHLSTAPATPPTPLNPAPPFRGVSMRVNRPGRMDQYTTGIDRIADTGADTVCLVFESHRENPTANDIYIDYRSCPTFEQMIALIDHAHAQRLRVIMMPIVLIDHGGQQTPLSRAVGWRPQSWDEWYQSYRNMLAHFATVAGKCNVELFVVGDGLTQAEAHADEWTNNVRAVRQLYKGPLTYVAHWDQVRSPTFWNLMDYIGSDCAWPMGTSATASDEEMRTRCQAARHELLSFAARQKKPLLLFDAGWPAAADAVKDPWKTPPPDAPVDVDIQKRLLGAFLQTWTPDPLWAGVIFDQYSPTASGPKDNSRSLFGKPAEKLLRDWFAQPRWKVDEK